MGIFRRFPITEKVGLQLRWEMFNATNHTNFNLGTTTVVAAGSANAGIINAAYSPRVMQAALKLNF